MNDWEIKAAITETINNYTGAASRLDIEAFANHFTEDAQVFGVSALVGQDGPLNGRQHIAAFFGPLFANLDWLIQQNTTSDIVISADGKHATAATNIVEMAQKKADRMIVMIGRYNDELVLTADGWRFSKRTLTPFRFSQLD